MAAGHIVGVVHTAAVVGSPAFGVTGNEPDLALPDEVLDAEQVGVVFHPVGDLPAGFELAVAHTVVARQIARNFCWHDDIINRQNIFKAWHIDIFDHVASCA